MSKKILSKRVVALVLALSMVFMIPLGNLSRGVKASTELDTSEMTEKEKKAYELTRHYSSHLPKIDPRVEG